MSHRGPFSEVSRAKNASSVLRRLTPYFAPFRDKLAIMGMLLLLGTLADLAGPYLIGVAVDQFISSGGSSAPSWLALLLGPTVSRRTGLTAVMLALAATYLSVWGLSVVQFRLMVRVAQEILLTMRSQILNQIQRLSIEFFDRQEAGDLMSRLINDTQVINQMFGEGLMRILRMGLSLIGIFISMIVLNWRLALASFAVLPLILVITVYFSQKTRRAFRQTRQTIGAVSAELQENIADAYRMLLESESEPTHAGAQTLELGVEV